MTHLEMEDEDPVESQIQPDREEADQHRRPLMVDGIEGGSEHLDAGVAHQADCVELKCLRRMQRVAVDEFSPLVDEGDDRLGQDNQSHGGGKRQEDRQTHGLRQCRAEASHLTQRRSAGNHRQGHRGHRDTEDP